MGAVPAAPREEVPSAGALLGRDVLTAVCRAGKAEVAAHELRKGNWWQHKSAFPNCSAKPRVEQGWPSQGGAAQLCAGDLGT